MLSPLQHRFLTWDFGECHHPRASHLKVLNEKRYLGAFFWRTDEGSLKNSIPGWMWNRTFRREVVLHFLLLDWLDSNLGMGLKDLLSQGWDQIYVSFSAVFGEDAVTISPCNCIPHFRGNIRFLSPGKLNMQPKKARPAAKESSSRGCGRETL